MLSAPALACLALAFALLMWPRRLPKGAHRAPGAFCIPFVGAPGLLLRQHKRLDYLLEHAKRYGPTFASGVPGKAVIVTTDVKNVEHVLKTNFPNYVKGKHFFDRLEELLGHGIFNVDGAEWKLQRKTASHMFSSRILREDMTPIFVEHARTVVALLDDAAATGKVVDMQDVFYRFTLDSIGQVAFGVNIDSLRSEQPFAAAFDRANGISTARFLSLFWRAARWLNVGSERKLRDDVAVLNAFAEQVIEERRCDPSLPQRRDVLSRYLQLRDEATGEPFSTEYLVGIINNFLIAGRDTTAQALSWLTYEVAQQPAIADRVAAEAARVVAPGQEPDFAAAAEMPYAAAVVNETLRLHPSVPMDPKCAVNDDVLPDGTFVPAGAFVIYTPWAMGRLPEHWGPDCETFNPDRWVGQPPVSPFKFTAFQAGPRTCLGQTMAPLEMKILMAMVYPRFRFELEPGQDVTYDLTATLAMKNGLKVRVFPASSSRV